MRRSPAAAYLRDEVAQQRPVGEPLVVREVAHLGPLEDLHVAAAAAAAIK